MHVNIVNAPIKLLCICTEMFTKAFEHCKRKLGPDHPETLMVIFKHGLCLENKKRFIEAEEKLMFVYTGRLKVLGPIDVETNNAAFAIGEFNRKLTRFHKAAEYYRIAYNGYLECKGKKDPVTAKTKVYLDEMINSQSSVCSLS